MPKKKAKIVKWTELNKRQQDALEQNCMTPREFHNLQTKYGVSAQSILEEVSVFIIRKLK
jgi:hypothetical protein